MAKSKQNNPAEDKDKNQSPEETPSEPSGQDENSVQETPPSEPPPPPEKPVPAPKKVHAVCMRDCMAVVNGNADAIFVREGTRVQIMTDAPGFRHFTELGDVKA